MSEASTQPVRIPIASVSPQFDVDTPNYRGLNPATYVLLALCYDSLAAPSTRIEKSELLNTAVAPVFESMVPRLAESFAEAADGSWTIRLRKGVLSHHGNELTAEDIKWAFAKVFTLDTVGAYRWGQMAGLDSIDDLEIVDSHSLRFKLRAPNPHLPAFLFCGVPLVVDAKVISKHATAADPWGIDWLSATHVAGFGPYELGNVSASGMQFVHRPDYWEDNSLPPAFLVERVSSRAEALQMLTLREPVFVPGLRCDEARSLQGRSDVQLAAAWGSHTYIGMNYNRPPFSDVRVRHALSYATPFGAIIDQGLLGLARRMRSPIPTFDRWYTDKYWKFDTDIDKARALLADAGYALGLDLVLHIPLRPDTERVGEIIKESYAKAGVNVDLRDLSQVPGGYFPTFWLRVECGHNFNEAVYDIAHDYAVTKPILPGPRAGGGVNAVSTAYPGSNEIEEKFRGILVAKTSDERQERIVLLQKDIIDFAPVIPVSENLLVCAATKEAGRWATRYENRVVQSLQFQNAGTGYLPA